MFASLVRRYREMLIPWALEAGLGLKESTCAGRYTGDGMWVMMVIGHPAWLTD